MSSGKFLAGMDLEEKKDYTYSKNFTIEVIKETETGRIIKVKGITDCSKTKFPISIPCTLGTFFKAKDSNNNDVVLYKLSHEGFEIPNFKDEVSYEMIIPIIKTTEPKFEPSTNKNPVKPIEKPSRTIRDILIDKTIEENREELKEKFQKAINEKLNKLGEIITYRIPLNRSRFKNIDEVQNRIEDFKKLEDKLKGRDLLDTTEDEFLELANKAFNDKNKTLADLMLFNKID